MKPRELVAEGPKRPGWCVEPSARRWPVRLHCLTRRTAVYGPVCTVVWEGRLLHRYRPDRIVLLVLVLAPAVPPELWELCPRCRYLPVTT